MCIAWFYKKSLYIGSFESILRMHMVLSFKNKVHPSGVKHKDVEPSAKKIEESTI